MGWFYLETIPRIAIGFVVAGLESSKTAGILERINIRARIRKRLTTIGRVGSAIWAEILARLLTIVFHLKRVSEIPSNSIRVGGELRDAG